MKVKNYHTEKRQVVTDLSFLASNRYDISGMTTNGGTMNANQMITKTFIECVQLQTGKGQS